MADNLDKFGISLDLDASGLQAELIKAQNELRKFQAQLKTSTDTAEISKLSGSISTLQDKITHLGSRMGEMAKPTGDATQSLVNLSRIAQDAPYGFIGIANNLNPMLEGFQRLSKESGGAGAALKTMVAGLSGPAGIGLALGVVSSLVVAFGDDLAKMFADMDQGNKTTREYVSAIHESQKAYVDAYVDMYKLKQAFEDFHGGLISKKELLKLYNSTLGDTYGKTNNVAEAERVWAANSENFIKSAILRAAAMKEIEKAATKAAEAFEFKAKPKEDFRKWYDVDLGAGVGAPGNMTTNDRARQDAQRQQEAIDGIKKEEKFHLDVAKAIEAEIKLIKEKAVYTNFVGKDLPKETTGASKPTFNADTKELDLLKKKQEYYKDDIYAFKDYADKIVAEELRIALLKAKHNKSSAEEIKAIQEGAAIDLLQNQKDLGMAIMKIADENTKEFEKNEKEAAKILNQQQREAAKDAIGVIQDQMDIEEKMAGKDFEKKKEAVRKAMQELKALMANSTNPKVIDDLGNAYTKLGKKLETLNIDEQNEKTKQLNDSYTDFAKTVSKGVSDGLMTMFDAMQKGESPLKALTDMIMKMVAQLAAAVVQALIFKAIMSAFGLGGLAGGEEGGGGGLLGGIGKIFGFAEGGIVSRPTIAMVGEGGQSEAIMPLNKLGNMMNSTFNSGAMSGAGGGGGNGQFVLKGSDLILAMNRSNFSLNVRR